MAYPAIRLHGPTILIVAFAVLAAGPISAAPAAEPAPRRPNLVVILADDK